MVETQDILKSTPILHDLVDAVEKRMVDELVGSGQYKFIEPNENVTHTFTPGMYAREITMFPGDRITSKIHLTEHQFIISQGIAIVYDMEGSHILTAPYHGVTKVGTRRVLLIPEESPVPTIWTTFHPLMEGETTVQQIEDRIIDRRVNTLLDNNNIPVTNKIKN